MKLQPVHDRIILRVVPETTDSGIELPFTKSPQRTGVVLAVGDGTRYSDGSLLPVRCRAGDRILFEGGAPIRLEGEDLVMIREAEIVGIFERKKHLTVAVESDVA